MLPIFDRSSVDPEEFYAEEDDDEEGLLSNLGQIGRDQLIYKKPKFIID